MKETTRKLKSTPKPCSIFFHIPLKIWGHHTLLIQGCGTGPQGQDTSKRFRLKREICNPPFAPLWAVGAKKQENKGHLKANNTCLSFWKWFFQINLPKHTTLVSSTTKNPRILRLDTFQRLEFFMKPQLGWYTMYLDKRSSICVSWIFCTCVPGDISTEHAVYTLKFWKNQVYIKKEIISHHLHETSNLEILWTTSMSSQSTSDIAGLCWPLHASCVRRGQKLHSLHLTSLEVVAMKIATFALFSHLSLWLNWKHVNCNNQAIEVMLEKSTGGLLNILHWSAPQCGEDNFSAALNVLTLTWCCRGLRCQR